MTISDTLTRLEGLAKGATDAALANVPQDDCVIYIHDVNVATGHCQQWAQYMAATRPAVVLALVRVVRAAQAVSAQRNGPYLMADMHETMRAEAALKVALSDLEKVANP